MPRHFLSIVLALDFDEADSPIGVQELVRKDLQYFYEERDVNVLEVSLNNVQALDYIRRIEHEVKKIGIKEDAALPHDVAAVCEAYKITLPATKKGAPPWRVPSEPCYGHVHALDSLNGKLVLTNGIKAFVIREDGKWCDVHYDWFIADDPRTLPEEYRVRKTREKKELPDFLQFNTVEEA
jgi:hypothetical protein